MKRFLALAPLAALAACVTPPPPPPIEVTSSATVRAEDFAWSAAEGANTITGAVSYRTGRGTWTCAGGSVGLTPETPYSVRRVEALYGSTRRAVLPVQLVRSRTVEQAAEDYSRYVRTTRCDAEGRFTFTGLPDGAWFVIAQAKPASGAAGEDALAVMERVEARGGRTVVLKLG